MLVAPFRKDVAVAAGADWAFVSKNVVLEVQREHSLVYTECSIM